MADSSDIQVQVTAASPIQTSDALVETDKDADSRQGSATDFGGLNLSDRLKETSLKDGFQRTRGNVSLDYPYPQPTTSLRRPSIIEMMNSGGLVINQRGSCEINLENLPAQDVERMYHYHGHRRGSFQPSENMSWSQSLDTKDSIPQIDDDESSVDSQRWWSRSWAIQRFNSPILEKHLGRTVVEFLRRRFRVALLFIGLFTLIWIVFFGVNIPFDPTLPANNLETVSQNTELAVYSVKYDIGYVLGAAVLFIFTAALLMVTYSKFYKVIAVYLSAFMIFLLMLSSFALALALYFYQEVQGFLTMSFVAQFTITSVVILITFTLSRVPTWISFIMCLLYLVVLEALLAVSMFVDQNPAATDSSKSSSSAEVRKYPSGIYIRSLVARAMFYVGLILVGVSTSYLTQLRQRVTFWKIAQCVLSRKALELERELEEQTILSMMPKPFADDLMNVQVQMAFMLKTKVGVESEASLDAPFQFISTPFNICSMDNVSILFADIVEFTRFSSSLSASELVGILNDVFSEFDELAMMNNCEKISTLGDCYFCVSGCPEPAQYHADNCVNMGLAIVSALEEFRRKTGYPIRMRIGIHTGSVFCGVMGTKRFKFDVWSKDVDIANRIESASSAGRVLISSRTKSFLSDDFIFEKVRAPSSMTDLSGVGLYYVDTRSLTEGPQIKSSLLKDDEETEKYSSLPTRQSFSTCESPVRKVASSSLCPLWGSNSTTVPVNRPLHESQTSTSIVDIFSRQKQLQRCTSYADLPVPKQASENNDRIVELMEEQNVNFDTYFDPKLKILSLDFHEPDLEASYRRHGQDLDDGSNGGMSEFTLGLQIAKLSYMIDTGVLFLTYLLIVVGCVTSLSSDDTLSQVWPPLLGVLLFGLVVEVTIVIFVTAVFAPKLFPKRFANFSTIIINWYARNLVALFMIYYPMTIVCVSIAQCSTGFESMAGLSHVQMAFFITILVLISSINFMDVSHVVKCVGGFLSGALAIGMIVGVHMSMCVAQISSNLTVSVTTATGRVTPNESPSQYVTTYFTRHVAPEALILILLVLILLIVVNRMSEVSVRLSFIARIEASARRRLARIRKAQADWLLYNIIPDHVARQLRKAGKYSHNHECVGVIFASIVNFRDFQLNSPNSDEESLRTLNVIISEFDALLDREQFCRIEKIKTIGSIYMAASGLSPDDQGGSTRHLLELVDFSEKLIEVLEQINAKIPSFVFRMRIGFNFGPVTAGVVGSRKMLFDIWGDTVNVASRMESTGLVNKVHMPENCLEKLSSFLKHEPSKVVNVKGKGEMRTVFVKRGTRHFDVSPYRGASELH